jgi:hypothetical protein
MPVPYDFPMPNDHHTQPIRRRFLSVDLDIVMACSSYVRAALLLEYSLCL